MERTHVLFFSEGEKYEHKYESIESMIQLSERMTKNKYELTQEQERKRATKCERKYQTEGNFEKACLWVWRRLKMNNENG